MCGIAGFVSPQQNVSSGFLIRASSLLRHRGPDDEGFLLLDKQLQVLSAFGEDTVPKESPEKRVAVDDLTHQQFLAGMMHRRLAIIAPDCSGHQPMASINQKVWISFNGEIYNYRELREELKSRGFSFRTRTDTEVLLNAWQCWGPDCLGRLDGMWAFALLDLESQTLFAASDAAGVKPFYYRSNSGNFFFASEIKALLHLSFSHNQEQIARYLIWGQSDEGAETHFSGIQRLEAGCFLRVSLREEGMARIQRWYQPEINPETGSFSKQDFRREAMEIRELLRETVSSRLQADVPLGICLSGGIDSSSVAALLSASDSERQQKARSAFMSVLPPGEKPDESAFAARAAEAAGLTLITTCGNAEAFVQSLNDIIYTMDSPPPGLNAFSQYAVFRLVSDHGIKVSLDGQGADELFGGYPAHQEAALLENLGCGRAEGCGPEVFTRMLMNEVRDFLPAATAQTLLLQRKPEMGIFRPEVFELAGPKKLRRTKSLNERLLYDYSSGILPFLLKAADRSSMRWSVESRMPFADSARLGKHLFSLPGNMKIRKGQSKALLREAMRSLVPEEILQRRDKVGFAAPNRVWLEALLKSEFAEGLPACPDWINAKMFDHHARAFLQNPTQTDASVLWRALAIRIWCGVFPGIQK